MCKETRQTGSGRSLFADNCFNVLKPTGSETRRAVTVKFTKFTVTWEIFQLVPKATHLCNSCNFIRMLNVLLLCHDGWTRGSLKLDPKKLF
jgi:hypothetical protein